MSAPVLVITRPTFNDNDTMNAAAFDAVAITSVKLTFTKTRVFAGRSTAGAGDAEELDFTVAGLALIQAADLSAQRVILAIDATNNTSDAAKPISTATQTALDLKAPLVSPALTGTPTAPTASTPTNNTQIATTAFVQAVVVALINSAPGALDTLKELADAIGDDPNFAATIATSIATKLAKASNLSDLTSAATARSNLGLGSNALGNRTVSTSAPSGGADGDIWLQV